MILNQTRLFDMTRNVSMPIIPVPEQAQRDALPEKSSIPSVLRNGVTGWPLLQISLFENAITQNLEVLEEYFVQSVAGGKCHDINYPVFFLACLLDKIPGKKYAEVFGRGRRPGTIMDATCISSFFGGYIFSHQKYGIDIKFEKTGYGYKHELQIADYSRSEMENLLYSIEEIGREVTKPSSTILDQGWSTESALYSSNEIIDNLAEGKAIFYEGQIFIDLSTVFSKWEKDHPENKTVIDSIKEVFTGIFKVNEFLALQTNHPELKPMETIPEILRLSTRRSGPTPSFFTSVHEEDMDIDNPRATCR